MSKISKILFLCAFLAIVAVAAVQLMTGQWINLNTILVFGAVALVAAAVIIDWKLYWEFLTMRTTKHGMNMGMLIVLTLTGLVCVNYLANKNNKTWDLTQEKLNSLSDQTTKILDSLKNDLEIKVFYKGPQAQEDKQKVKQALMTFADYSGKLKIRYINAYVEQGLAAEYLKDTNEREPTSVNLFVDYNGRRIAVEEPFDEAAVTSALIKATREGESKIYFLKGHGERDLEGSDDQGLKDFAKALGEASFKVEGLVLIDKKEIPADAALVAIIGPQVPYLESELDWLRAYVERGGKLFIALDPGQRHNLANLTKTLGVQFQNNFVITMAPIVGGGPATVLGRSFDSTSDITKSFPSGASFAVFPLVSEVIAAADKPGTTEVKDIVKSDNFSFTVTDISKPVREKPNTVPVTVGVSVKGSVGKVEMTANVGKEDQPAQTSSKQFEAVIFGDSDFISNRGLMLGVNRDLAVNAMAELANQKDLISIRPKMPKGTMVTMSAMGYWGVVIGCMALPLILLITSGVMWFRRRGA